MKHTRIINFLTKRATIVGLTSIFLLASVVYADGPIIVNHENTVISQIPAQAIEVAKSTLHIAYGHTSHGSQVITGMNALAAANSLYSWNNGGTDGALDLHDNALGGDVGYYPDWVNNTRAYLGTPNPSTGRGTINPDVNVIMWSWCGQASSKTQQTMINEYLAPMTQLEVDYPGIKFVYMTGHLDGSGEDGDLNVRNQQIRDYCNTNNKILFDFADIESYEPNGTTNYMVLDANDNCDYSGGNWATAWIAAHLGNELTTLASSCGDCAHSQKLNCAVKGRAIWWLWARLAGWGSIDPVTFSLTLTKHGSGSGTISSFPSGIDCGTTCNSSFPAGTVVTLTAVADLGSYFTSWDPPCSGNGVCTFTINSDIPVRATFSTAENPFTDVPQDYWAYAHITAIYNAGYTTGYGAGTFAPELSVTREQMAAFIVRAADGEPATDYCSTGSPFPDCSADSWSCRYIKRLYDLGLTTGYGTTGLFMPAYNVSREQMAAFIVRAVGGEPAANYCSSGSPFTDVLTTDWSCIYIKRLYELGITTGYGDGRYGPDDLVTRAQMAVFLGRAFLGME